MGFRHYFGLFGILIGLLLSGLLRPGWAPGVLDGGHHDARVPDGQTREWLRREMRLRGIPGLSYALVLDGRVAAVEALGVSDFWSRDPLRPDSLMEVASNSKVVTALAATRQVGVGRLDLQQPLVDYRPDFLLRGEHADEITLQMLLTHTAGLGTALGQPYRIDHVPGERYRYSGVGFEVVGELIANTVDSDLPTALISTVLAPLGVSDQATYGQVNDAARLASPHVSIVMPLAMLLFPAALVFGLLALIVALARRIGWLRRTPGALPAWLAGISTAIAAVLPFILGTANASTFALVDLVFVMLAILLLIALRKRSVVRSALALSILAALALAITLQVPVPLKERVARYPAAAGLRASARDMGSLLAGLLRPPPAWEATVAEVVRPRVRVNEENSWGLGIGIQQIGPRAVIWHWGVNYPGYQSLMLGIPETGDGLVVLMNGGSLLLVPGGARYTGLELARDLAAQVLPGPHGAYWHGIQ